MLANRVCSTHLLAARPWPARRTRPGAPASSIFSILGGELYLVDMPGYGYARASKSLIKAWTRLIQDYLKGRAQLTRVFLLIDARHGVKPSDADVMVLLDEAAVSYQVVLTKADKLKSGQCETLLSGNPGLAQQTPSRSPGNHHNVGQGRTPA